MSTEKQPYEQRVQALAKEYAKIAFRRKHGHIPTDVKDSEVNDFSEFARIAVAELADMARHLYYSRFIREGYSGYEADKLTEKELKYQGLIPDTALPDLPTLQPGEPGAGIHNPDNPAPDWMKYKAEIETAFDQSYPEDGPEFVGNMFDIFSAGYMAAINVQEDE